MAEEGLQSYSSLGGWNLFKDASTRDPDAAYEFIRFMSAPEQQKSRSIEGSVLPTRRSSTRTRRPCRGCGSQSSGRKP